jgi:hypothetical protein
MANQSLLTCRDGNRFGLILNRLNIKDTTQHKEYSGDYDQKKRIFNRLFEVMQILFIA